MKIAMSSREEVNYQRLNAQAAALLAGVKHRVTSAANFSALLYAELGRVNWVGFYFLEGETLYLGPFQGLPACVEIPVGAGVCGTAAANRKTIRVANVHEFDGHIACDVNSESEIVIPLVRHGVLLGVLDIDSPEPDRFSDKDETGLVQLAETFLQHLN